MRICSDLLSFCSWTIVLWSFMSLIGRFNVNFNSYLGKTTGHHFFVGRGWKTCIRGVLFQSVSHTFMVAVFRGCPRSGRCSRRCPTWCSGRWSGSFPICWYPISKGNKWQKKFLTSIRRRYPGRCPRRCPRGCPRRCPRKRSRSLGDTVLVCSVPDNEHSNRQGHCQHHKGCHANNLPVEEI